MESAANQHLLHKFLWFDTQGSRGVPRDPFWSTLFTNELLFLIVWVVTHELVLIRVMMIWIVIRWRFEGLMGVY